MPPYDSSASKYLSEPEEIKFLSKHSWICHVINPAENTYYKKDCNKHTTAGAYRNIRSKDFYRDDEG